MNYTILTSMLAGKTGAYKINSITTNTAGKFYNNLPTVSFSAPSTAWPTVTLSYTTLYEYGGTTSGSVTSVSNSVSYADFRQYGSGGLRPGFDNRISINSNDAGSGATGHLEIVAGTGQLYTAVEPWPIVNTKTGIYFSAWSAPGGGTASAPWVSTANDATVQTTDIYLTSAQGGSGYTSAPTVTFTRGGKLGTVRTNPVATATVSGGKVTSIIYNSVTVGEVTTSYKGVLTNVSIEVSEQMFNSNAWTLSLSGGGGSGAYIGGNSAQVQQVPYTGIEWYAIPQFGGNTLQEIIDRRGSGFNSDPTCTVGPSSAVVGSNIAYGQIVYYWTTVIDNGGNGYTQSPSVFATSGTPSYSTIYGYGMGQGNWVDNYYYTYLINTINVTDKGLGYTSSVVPTITLTGLAWSGNYGSYTANMIFE